MSLGLIKDEMIVIKAMAIDTYPAYEDGTPIVVCITGQAEPSRESGSPRLTNARYITANNREPISSIFLSSHFS